MRSKSPERPIPLWMIILTFCVLCVLMLSTMLPPQYDASNRPAEDYQVLLDHIITNHNRMVTK